MQHVSYFEAYPGSSAPVSGSARAWIRDWFPPPLPVGNREPTDTYANLGGQTLRRRWRLPRPGTRRWGLSYA